jgi:hypothetical protein
MKLKVLLWSAACFWVLVLGAGAYWWLSRPQVMVLGDGTRLSLLAVTYGKTHKFPMAKVGGRKVQRMGTITTPDNSLCVWLDQKHDQNNWPNFQLLAFDGDNTACCGSQRQTQGGFSGNNRTEQIVGIVFEAFPRHDRKIYLRAQNWNQRNGQQEISSTTFAVHNPAPRSGYPKWTPDVLPVTRDDDDLRVTLTRCEIKENEFNNYGSRQEAKTKDPTKNGVLIAFRVEQKDAVVTNWQPVQVETSDATGNHTGNRSWSNRKENDEQVMSYQWGLWPDEPAWKLRVEMSRQSGFTPEETWTVPDLPLKPGDINRMWQRNKQDPPFAETTMSENHVKMFPVIKLSDEQARNYGGYMEGVFRINVDPPPDGMRMTVIKITDDQGRPIEFNNWGWGGGDFRFSLKKLTDVKTINVTLALHRSRYVEFTVKPPRK